MLSQEGSAEPGRWRTDRAPYLRGIMDAVSDPTCETVVVMSSAQVGKTETILNSIGYSMEHDPSPILVVHPTLEMAQAFSKDKFAPMLRDTPCLQNVVGGPRGRDGANTMLHKQFTGGHITMAGANSPASLAARSVRRVYCDDIDRFPPTAGAEGDPLKLARKRATTFFNRKYMETSTPTIKEVSRIEKRYNESDQRRYFVPCAECGDFQVWGPWKHIEWDKVPAAEVTKRKKLPPGAPVMTHNNAHFPETAAVVCEHCGHRHSEPERLEQVRHGEWRATAVSHKIAGFHFNQVISPWVPLADMVREFIESAGDPELLKTWTNTALGETFEELGETTDGSLLYARREVYDKIPLAAVILTAGVDVQDDRLEVEVVAWGEGKESWGIEKTIFMGDPGVSYLWQRLDEYLMKLWPRDDGRSLRIAAVGVDSGGHYTQEVYRFCRERERRQIHALKGIAGAGKPIAQRPHRKGSRKNALLVLAGVDTAKERLLLSWLKIEKPGPGYCHFPNTYDEDYFKQLTAERQVTKYHKGFPHKEWEKRKGARNEALDCRIYAIVALELLNPNFEAVGRRVKNESAVTVSPSPAPASVDGSLIAPSVMGSAGFGGGLGDRPF